MICPNCGASIEENIKTCNICGYLIKQDWKQGLLSAKIEYDQNLPSRSRRRKPEDTFAAAKKTVISDTSFVATTAMEPDDQSAVPEQQPLDSQISIIDRTDAREDNTVADTENKTKKEKKKKESTQIGGLKKGIIITLVTVLIVAGITAFGYYSNQYVITRYKSWDQMINTFLGLE